MKVAAYQSRLRVGGARDAREDIARQIKLCEAEGVEILCCPEAVIGGLADYAGDPAEFAIDVGQLRNALAPLASSTVTTIVGFTEIAPGNRLYNAAAVFQDGQVLGVYRKLHPAVNRSIYAAGDQTPVFTVNGLTFGILICNDSNFAEPARIMSSRGATVLFIPTK